MDHTTAAGRSARGPALGDSAAAALVEQHGHFLAFLERWVRSAADAEEILQAAYLKGVSAPEGPRDESVVAWFYRILRNAVVSPRPAAPHALASSGVRRRPRAGLRPGGRRPGAGRLEPGAWVVAGAWGGAAMARVPPFRELELLLAARWVPGAPDDQLA